ncbi:RtcB family protein [Halovulum sp. GXIMD14793]
MTKQITGQDLIAMGYEPGAWFGAALGHVNTAGLSGEDLRSYLDSVAPQMIPKIPLQDRVGYAFNLEAETEAEVENVAAVKASMDILMRTPTVVDGAVMPDACPAGPVGTIPVGGVAVAQNAIHPGMHSADICCSVMLTEFVDADPKTVLDAVHKATHFGPGGRENGQRYTLPPDIYEAAKANRFLQDPKIKASLHTHLGTQGDGNHFAFVGTSKATGATCLVTHHGSRGPGAGLYKAGMKVAEAYRCLHSPATLKQNAWLPADSEDGTAYWEALQIIRDWTKANHDVIHQATLRLAGLEMTRRFWNEHNFVFRQGDLFYHAKGATPIDDAFLPDTNGTQIVPLNMAEPVLLIQSRPNERNKGFAPHGAGRNFSRSAHKRANAGRTEAEIFAQETAGLDARFFSGNIDISELPSAYKSAAAVRAQMEQFDLASVVDEIMPYGCIMAEDWEKDAPWRRKRAAKAAAR